MLIQKFPSKQLLLTILFINSLTVGVSAVFAQTPNKDQYSIFNPTPENLLRDMSTDRPDKTESAYTVDAGYFQLEMDLVNYIDNHDHGGSDHSLSIAPINLKAGLTSNIDLQLIFDSYQRVRSRSPEASETVRNEGVGDITSRLKVNLWGNDGGRTALSVMPFVKFPVNSNDLGNDSYEGGVIFPFAVELCEDFSLGLMTELDILRNDEDNGNYESYINTITLGHDLNEEVGAYIEFFSEIPSEQSDEWIGTADFGMTYAVTRDIQLDAGLNVGVTDAADDLNPFAGLSWRFK